MKLTNSGTARTAASEAPPTLTEPIKFTFSADDSNLLPLSVGSVTSFRQLSAGEALWSSAFMSCFVSLSLSLCPLTTQLRFYEEPPPFTPKASTLLCTYVPPKEREREKGRGNNFNLMPAAHPSHPDAGAA